MSEPVTAKGSSGLGIGLGIAGGCTLGCVAIVVAIGGFAWWSVRSLTQQIEVMAEQAKATAAVQQEIVALDAKHLPRLTADLDQLELTPADLDAYETVRERVDGVLVTMAESHERMERLATSVEPGQPPDFRQIMDLMREAQGAVGNEMESRTTLTVAVRDALREAALGPTDFTRLLEVVEWQFLKRPEAAPLALPADQRFELESQRQRVQELGRLAADPRANPVTIRLWLEDEGPPEASIEELRQRLRKELATANERLGELEAEAASGGSLSAAARAVLEARRPELEARDLPELGPLLAVLAGRGSEWTEGTWEENDQEDESVTPDQVVNAQDDDQSDAQDDAQSDAQSDTR